MKIQVKIPNENIHLELLKFCTEVKSLNTQIKVSISPNIENKDGQFRYIAETPILVVEGPKVLLSQHYIENRLKEIFQLHELNIEDFKMPDEDQEQPKKDNQGYDWRKLLKEAEPKEETTTKYNLWYSKPVDTNTFSPGISVDSILPEKDYDLRVLQEVSIRLDLLKKLIDKLTPIYEEEGCLADLKEEVAGIVQELSSIIEG